MFFYEEMCYKIYIIFPGVNHNIYKSMIITLSNRYKESLSPYVNRYLSSIVSSVTAPCMLIVCFKDLMQNNCNYPILYKKLQ